ncbi:flavodoxin family protein [Dehalogenimonas alkenigignens]|uniref:flavodoxin family protein n=1 Tax=Dehalogenimonas alkenigignens TaxID=1217799 RepID=UPI000D5804EC|nr:hypothetical protein [Dehalogenimonas alkenigignens]PVV83285.1 hypothetical protein DD509_06845 [Dehalogenimonas alkenigignens]
MKATVVYQSLWGNTALIAHAIAEGLGPDTKVLSTFAAAPESLLEDDLLIIGSPVLGFSLPNDKMIESIRANFGKAPSPPDLTQPSMRTWLGSLPPGKQYFAAFETRVKGPFGKATPAIYEIMQKLGYRPITDARQFIVTGTYGPLKDGEVERGCAWGTELKNLYLQRENR